MVRQDEVSTPDMDVAPYLRPGSPRAVPGGRVEIERAAQALGRAEEHTARCKPVVEAADFISADGDTGDRNTRLPDKDGNAVALVNLGIVPDREGREALGTGFAHELLPALCPAVCGDEIAMRLDLRGQGGERPLEYAHGTSREIW